MDVGVAQVHAVKSVRPNMPELKHLIADMKKDMVHIYLEVEGVTYYVLIQKFNAPLVGTPNPNLVVIGDE